MSMSTLTRLIVISLCVGNVVLSLHLHAPPEFQDVASGLIPADIAALDDRNLTQREDKLLIEAIIKLGNSEGEANRFLEQHDVHLAAETAVALQTIERKFARMSKPAIQFIGKLIEYLQASYDNQAIDEKGNPTVPKEVHEISLSNSWSTLDNKTRSEIETVFPSVATSLQDKQFDKHAHGVLAEYGWIVN